MKIRSSLKPEILIDSTSWRWNRKKRAKVGIATMVDAAMMYPWELAYCCWKLEIATTTCTPQRSRSVVMVSGQRHAVPVDPPLTTLAQPVRRMTDGAVRLLLERIEGRRDQARSLVFDLELRVRRSCGGQRFGGGEA